MRIALTRLRTTISFFSPIVADTECRRLKGELKWLNAHLGAVRDLDVAVGRFGAADKQRRQAMPHYRSWQTKRADSHRQLARALRSARYRLLVKCVSRWIEDGPWSNDNARQAAKQRAATIAAYGARKLGRWHAKLLKQSRGLPEMGPEKRHRLRLMNKKLSYAIDLLEDLLSGKEFSRQRAALKYLRKAQKALGQLNDDAVGRSLAISLQREGLRASIPSLTQARKKRLIRTAAAAYQKLASST